MIAALCTDVLFRGHGVEDCAVWTRIFGVVSEYVCAKLVEGKRVEQSHARSVSKVSVRLPADKATVFYGAVISAWIPNATPVPNAMPNTMQPSRIQTERRDRTASMAFA